MFSSSGKSPPFSPVLLFGMATSPLPAVLLQPFVSAVFSRLRRAHPNLFDRLVGLDDATFLIDPTDLPFAFVLHVNSNVDSNESSTGPRIVTVGPNDKIETSSSIRGSFLSLINLLEGRIDGDALFFSREIAIEGDTEAVVALRNAVDDADINVERDILSTLGPFSGLLARLTGAGKGVFAKASRDLDLLQTSIIARGGNKTKTGSGK
ncbi:MAG: SCP2 sterol-binding domain-containing protein [Rhodospirillaceae bacterium]|nr:SCP2 sterol-binding domain-containing protein [Rhodospirillaceae bacterium]